MGIEEFVRWDAKKKKLSVRAAAIYEEIRFFVELFSSVAGVHREAIVCTCVVPGSTTALRRHQRSIAKENSGFSTRMKVSAVDKNSLSFLSPSGFLARQIRTHPQQDAFAETQRKSVGGGYACGESAPQRQVWGRIMGSGGRMFSSLYQNIKSIATPVALNCRH